MSRQIADSSLEPGSLSINESLFALGNGYLGVRGNFEEGYPHYFPTIRGTYINAFYDTATIHYGEGAYGYPQTKQKLMNVIDAQSIEIRLGEDQERFSLFSGKVLSFDRTLDFDRGISERRIDWRSPHGKEVRLTFRRLVSLARRELFAVEVRIEPMNFFGKATLISTVNGAVKNFSDKSDPRVGSGDGSGLRVIDCRRDGNCSMIVDQALNSKLKMSCLSLLELSVPCQLEMKASDDRLTTSYTFSLERPVTAIKKNIYTDTLRHGASLVEKGREILKTVENLTLDNLISEQSRYLAAFWASADITINGDSPIQEGIRFNIFHLLQAAGHDSVSSIAAKGLSGEGYEGHYFWDTEIFMLPFFILTKPEIARKLLLYRYSILDSARARAREMGHRKGALFPWRTISGTECSAFFPAGTAQYHISADIAYSCVQYYLTTKDDAFMVSCGFEILVETARLWVDAGHVQGGRFRIDAVTGPDEYTALVDNNYYTNAMAQYNLLWAGKVYHILERNNPQELKKIADRLQLADQEMEEWIRAGEMMYLPYDPEHNINPQDDTFMKKKVWDFEDTPEDHYPLLLHYHPLILYRHQVCKQADTVLAYFLLEGRQNLETVKNSYHYYEKVTTHDSSLSTCIFSIMASRIGEVEKAFQYFKQSARIDLDDIQGNTKDGLHMANMGGSWMAIVFGFGGVRISESGLSLRPVIPDQWRSYSFHLVFQGRNLAISIQDKKGICVLESGQPLTVRIYDRPVRLEEQVHIRFNVEI